LELEWKRYSFYGIDFKLIMKIKQREINERAGLLRLNEKGTYLVHMRD
jgi:hypothetical protein